MRAVLVRVTCDLCGWEDDAERMHQLGSYDACKWCYGQTPIRQTECGRHLVTIPAGDVKNWSCSCGATRASAFPSFYAWDPRAEAFPNIWHRLASMHAESM